MEQIKEVLRGWDREIFIPEGPFPRKQREWKKRKVILRLYLEEDGSRLWYACTEAMTYSEGAGASVHQALKSLAGSLRLNAKQYLHPLHGVLALEEDYLGIKDSSPKKPYERGCLRLWQEGQQWRMSRTGQAGLLAIGTAPDVVARSFANRLKETVALHYTELGRLTACQRFVEDTLKTLPERCCADTNLKTPGGGQGLEAKKGLGILFERGRCWRRD